MSQLYPLKFSPIIKSKVWGGNRLKNLLGKNQGQLPNIGESWELSAVPGELSVVTNGNFNGENIEQLISEYKGALVGEKNYKRFGNQFPLLIKFIDANDYLSIQVHPDDELAQKRHNSFGKTEMWYIVDAEPDAELIVGFNQEMDKQKYLEYFENGKLLEVLNREKVNQEDVFFIPAGRVHATGPGILFAEIQQTSDITYRIYDWDRVDDKGNSRELHTNQAIDAMDFKQVSDFKTNYQQIINGIGNVVDCKYFTTNSLILNREIERDYSLLDSFVVLIAIEGEISINYNGNPCVELIKGETVLIPAAIKQLQIIAISDTAKVLETYI